MAEWLTTAFEGWTFHHSGKLATQAMTILALHGFTGSGLDFRQLADHPKAPAGALWIAPDLPGHGRTGVLERSESTLDAMAAVLGHFLARSGLHVHLLGYSMGGRLALTFATQSSFLSTVTVIGAHPGIEDEAERQQRAATDHILAQRIRDLGAPAFAEEWESMELIRSQSRIPEPFRTALKTRRRRQSAEGLARCLEASGTGSMRPLGNDIRAMPCPLLYLHGQDDAKFGRLGQKLAGKLSALRVAEVQGVGHCAHLEHTEAFFDLFARHLDQNES